MAKGGALGAFIQPVGVDQRQGGGQLCAAFVVIDHHHIHPRRACLGQRLMRHGAAIHRHDQAGAALRQPHQCLAAGAIAFQQPIGDIVIGPVAQRADQPDQQRRAGGAVHVIIAIDGDRLGALDGIGQPVRGAVHIGKHRRIGQEGAQRWRAVAGQILARTPRESRICVTRSSSFTPCPARSMLPPRQRQPRPESDAPVMSAECPVCMGKGETMARR
jgi:hypothetical protein